MQNTCVCSIRTHWKYVKTDLSCVSIVVNNNSEQRSCYIYIMHVRNKTYYCTAPDIDWRTGGKEPRYRYYRQRRTISVPP